MSANFDFYVRGSIVPFFQWLWVVITYPTQTKTGRKVTALAVVLIALLFALVPFLRTDITGVSARRAELPAMPELAPMEPGDCRADGTAGDNYPAPDWYCLPVPGTPAVTIVVTNAEVGKTPTVEPTITVTHEPTITVTATSTTPAPTVTATPTEPTRPPVVVTTPAPPTTEVPPTVEPTEPPVTETPAPTQEPTAKPTKEHCDKGEGNGGEDCDPGNNPDKGNDDEDDQTPGKGKGKLGASIFLLFSL